MTTKTKKKSKTLQVIKNNYPVKKKEELKNKFTFDDIVEVSFNDSSFFIGTVGSINFISESIISYDIFIYINTDDKKVPRFFIIPDIPEEFLTLID